MASEINMQAECIKWFYQSSYRFEHNKMLFCVYNNQSDRYAGQIAKNAGVITGVSDLILIVENAVHFIELKLPKGIQSKDQEVFQKQVNQRGHSYYLVYSLEGFKSLIIKLLPNG